MKVWSGVRGPGYDTVWWNVEGSVPVTFAKAKYSHAKIPANCVTGRGRRCSEIFAALLGGALRLKWYVGLRITHNYQTFVRCFKSLFGFLIRCFKTLKLSLLFSFHFFMTLISRDGTLVWVNSIIISLFLIGTMG